MTAPWAVVTKPSSEIALSARALKSPRIAAKEETLAKRAAEGPLSDDQQADARLMADVAAQWVLDMQADAPTAGRQGRVRSDRAACIRDTRPRCVLC